MNILFLYNQLRAGGSRFLRSHYFLEDLKNRGHKIELAHFIQDMISIKSFPEKFNKDAFSHDDIINFQPKILIFELSNINRYPSRDWIKEIKRKGCIVVHCGLDYNDYLENKDRYDIFFRDAGFEIYNGSEKYLPPAIYGESLGDQTSRTDVDTLKRYCSIRNPRIFENVPWVESSLALVISSPSTLINAGLNSQIKAYNSDRDGEKYAKYGGFNEFEGIEILITGHFITDGDTVDEGKHNRTFLINVLEYLGERHPLKFQITTKNQDSDIQESNSEENLNASNTIQTSIYSTKDKLEGLEKLKAILQEKLSNDEVKEILAELTVASGEGSVSIGGDATEAVIVTGDKNIVGDNNQVTINHGTDAETMREFLRSIERNIKVANFQAADRKNRTVRGRVAVNSTTAVKLSTVKKATPSPKKPNTTRISKNITILNNTHNSVPVRITAVRELGRDAKGDNSAISWLLSLIQKRNGDNDLIAAGITALSKISDGRASIVTTIISTLRFNQSSSVVISAMNAFGKIAIENSDAADKMLDLLSNRDNTIEMKESIIRNLGKVANGNNKAIDRLIPILNSTQDLIKTRKLAADSLVQIDRGYPATSKAMADLLADKKLSTAFKDYIAASLKKIDPSNSKLALYNKAKAARK